MPSVVRIHLRPQKTRAIVFNDRRSFSFMPNQSIIRLIGESFVFSVEVADDAQDCASFVHCDYSRGEVWRIRIFVIFVCEYFAKKIAFA